MGILTEIVNNEQLRRFTAINIWCFLELTLLTILENRRNIECLTQQFIDRRWQA